MKFHPQFKLRTLFALIALISIPLGWVACQLNWIRERHKVLSRPQENESSSFTLPKPLPWQLRLFGEPRVYRVAVPKSELARARELFPEAQVEILRENEVKLPLPKYIDSLPDIHSHNREPPMTLFEPR
jgi:hypothetical protein